MTSQLSELYMCMATTLWYSQGRTASLVRRCDDYRPMERTLHFGLAALVAFAMMFGMAVPAAANHGHSEVRQLHRTVQMAMASM